MDNINYWVSVKKMVKKLSAFQDTIIISERRNQLSLCFLELNLIGRQGFTGTGPFIKNQERKMALQLYLNLKQNYAQQSAGKVMLLRLYYIKFNPLKINLYNYSVSK